MYGQWSSVMSYDLEAWGAGPVRVIQQCRGIYNIYITRAIDHSVTHPIPLIATQREEEEGSHGRFLQVCFTRLFIIGKDWHWLCALFGLVVTTIQTIGAQEDFKYEADKVEMTTCFQSSDSFLREGKFPKLRHFQDFFSTFSHHFFVKLRKLRLLGKWFSSILSTEHSVQCNVCLFVSPKQKWLWIAIVNCEHWEFKLGFYWLLGIFCWHDLC